MKVKDILSMKPSDVITITAERSLLDASKLLSEHNIGALVVVDGDRNPVGILSERDIVRRMARMAADAVDYSVGEAMTQDIIIGLPDDELSHVSGVMTNKRIRHLPIMDKDKLIGIISIGDVVKAQLDDFAQEAHMLRQYITGGYS